MLNGNFGWPRLDNENAVGSTLQQHEAWTRGELLSSSPMMTLEYQGLLSSSPEESAHESFLSDIEAFEQEDWQNFPSAVAITTAFTETEGGNVDKNDDRDNMTSVC